jgi:hypothetical protein
LNSFLQKKYTRRRKKNNKRVQDIILITLKKIEFYICIIVFIMRCLKEMRLVGRTSHYFCPEEMFIVLLGG